MRGWDKTKNKNVGFTIVELLIVIVVIAILAAITIVAYTGIQNQAKQSANLAAIDSWEKGLRLYSASKGEVPAAVPINMGSYNATIMAAVDAIVAGTASSQPVSAELSTQGCLPGEYPATDIFHQGECSVQLTIYDFNDSNLPKITSRMSTIVSTNVIDAVDSTYISTLPNLSMDIQKQSVAITNYPIQLTSSSQQTVTKLGGQTTISAFRGAQYSGSSYNNAKFAYIIYYAQGDQVCGRGVKTLSSFSDLAEQYGQLQDQFNQTADPASPISIDYSYDGAGVWTKCAVTVR